MLVLTTRAIEQYQQCFQCFFLHRGDFYFCESSGECLPSSWADCLENDRIYTQEACANSISQDCPSYTFDETTYSMAEPDTFQVTLNEGNGCYVEINRTQGGSYGTLTIESNDPYLLVFDDYILEYETNTALGLVEVDSYIGWEPRQVFIANIGLVPSEFQVSFDAGSTLLTRTITLLAAALIILH